MQKFLLLFFLAAGSDLGAQHDSIAIGRVTYQHQIDLQGDNEYNGAAVLYFNVARSTYIHLGVPLESFKRQINEFTSAHIAGDAEGFPVFKWHGGRKMWSKIPCYLSRQHCIVEDTLGAIAWTIYPAERRRFGSYECYKAGGMFGGREYEAWFTYDIPISSGPYKLGGLPGLILQARTLDDKVQFLFAGLEMSPDLSQLILPPSGKFINMNYAQYVRNRDEQNARLVKEFQAKGIEVSITAIKDTIELTDN